MNSNEELSAIGVASPTPVNPHHVSQRLVETNMENAPLTRPEFARNTAP